MRRSVVALRTRGARIAGIGLCLLLVCAVAGAPGVADASRLHFEIAQPNGINGFSGYNYICEDCTAEQYAAMVLPAGYAKRNDRILLPSTSGGFPATPPPGVPVGLDFVPDIPGEEFFFCCEIVNGAFVGSDPSGILFTSALVKRSNVFTYAAGEVLHELVDPQGNRWALFLIDVVLAQTMDPTVVGSLAGFARPAGWSYESRVLTEPLHVGTQNGLADNIGQVALGVGVLGSWQRYEVVPEPGTLLLVAGGLAGIASARRSRPVRE